MMMNNINKRLFLSYFSDLFFILVVFGYPILTIMLLSNSIDDIDNSVFITIPYRIVVLLISILFIVFFKLKVRNTIEYYYIFLYVILLAVRYVHNFLFDDVFSNYSFLTKSGFFIFFVDLPLLFASAKCVYLFDHRRVLKISRYLILISLIVSIQKNGFFLNDFEGRGSGGVALNSISFGHFALSGLLLSLYSIVSVRCRKWYNIFIDLLLIIVSFLCIVKAASRGPLICLFLVLVFWFLSVNRNFLMIIMLNFFLFVIYLFRFEIIDLIGVISHTMKSRLLMMVVDGDSSGRDEVFYYAMQIINDNILFGRYFAIPPGFYSHNMFIDSLLSSGIVGFSLLLIMIFTIFNISFRMLSMSVSYGWIVLILLQYIFMLQFSGTIYFSSTFIFLVPFLFSLPYSNNKH